MRFGDHDDVLSAFPSLATGRFRLRGPGPEADTSAHHLLAGGIRGVALAGGRT